MVFDISLSAQHVLGRINSKAVKSSEIFKIVYFGPTIDVCFDI